MTLSPFSLGRPRETPELVALNRLPGRAPLFPFSTEKSALRGDPAKSPYVLNLNGDWAFKLFDRPEGVPEACLRESYKPAAEWDAIEATLGTARIGQVDVEGMSLLEAIRDWIRT